MRCVSVVESILKNSSEQFCLSIGTYNLLLNGTSYNLDYVFGFSVKVA